MTSTDSTSRLAANQLNLRNENAPSYLSASFTELSGMAHAYDQDVVGSSLAMCWTSLFFSITLRDAYLIQVSSRCDTTHFSYKITLAVQLEAKQALLASNEQKNLSASFSQQ